MRVAFITERDPAIPCGAARTIQALHTHAPRDIQIFDYHPGRERFSGVRPDQILQRVKRDCIDLIHLATFGPSAIAVVFAAWRLEIPVVGSLPPHFGSTSLRRKYLSALSEKCERVFASSSAARGLLIAAGVESSRIASWRPGVDAEIFAPSK